MPTEVLFQKKGDGLRFQLLYEGHPTNCFKASLLDYELRNSYYTHIDIRYPRNDSNKGRKFAFNILKHLHLLEELAYDKDEKHRKWRDKHRPFTEHYYKGRLMKAIMRECNENELSRNDPQFLYLNHYLTYNVGNLIMTVARIMAEVSNYYLALKVTEADLHKDLSESILTKIGRDYE